jgi:azurin
MNLLFGLQNLNHPRLVLTLMLSCATASAYADDCTLSVEANDLMQFNVKTLQVPSTCQQVEVKLKHVGKQDAHVLGHDWVLARTADITALTNAGLAAGFDRGYLPPGDPRILASTGIVGGGQETTIKFSMEKLAPGGDYTFFCSFPGHAALMRGRFVVGPKPSATK